MSVSTEQEDRCILCDGEWTPEHPVTCPDWPKEDRHE
jgi:hypothetical protein